MATTDATPDDLISPAEARALLGGIPAGTLASMLHRRQVPHYRLAPRIVKFSKRELLEWVAARRVEAAAK